MVQAYTVQPTLLLGYVNSCTYTPCMSGFTVAMKLKYGVYFKYLCDLYVVVFFGGGDSFGFFGGFFNQNVVIFILKPEK